MSKQLQWVIGGFALLIVGFVALQIYLQIDLKNVNDGINSGPKIETETPTIPSVVVSEEKPEDVPGFNWVRHGDQWDKEPIDNRDVLVEHPVVVKPPLPPKTEPKPKKELYTGSLTFHEELLKTNPVKALRLQQEERGHWSAQWIPPFPIDDTEAQQYARVLYLRRYYWLTYGEKLHTPEYVKVKNAYDKARLIENQMFDTINSYPYGARQMDLMKLSWPWLDEEPVSGPGGHPSEYFGDPEAREFMKQHGGWKY